MFLKEGYWSKRVDVQRTATQSSDLNIHLISQEYGTNTGMYISLLDQYRNNISTWATAHLPIPQLNINPNLFK